MTIPTAAELLNQLEALHAATVHLPWNIVGGTHDKDIVCDHGDYVDGAALIVAAVNALPALTAEIRRLRGIEGHVHHLAERAARHGYDLDPDDVLAALGLSTDPLP